MYKKLAVFTFLSFMGVAFLELSVFAEGPASPPRQMCLASISDIYLFGGESATWNIVMDGEDNTFFHSPDPWRVDGITGLESADADEFGDFNGDGSMAICVVVGLKYFFKSFQLNRLKKSFLSFIDNSHKTGQEPEPSLAFYLDLP
jgi:hypothetical protein